MSKYRYKAPSKETKDAVWEKTNGRCWYCGKRTDRSKGEFVVEHVVPVSEGGAHALSNFAGACRSCNARKGSKSIEQFRDYLSAYTWLGRVLKRHQIKVLRELDVDMKVSPHVFWGESRS